MDHVPARLQGYRRELMTAGASTELFFLDEATALAAGHRPCGTCRRKAYTAFKERWLAANPDLACGYDGSIRSIDRLLHAERIDGSGRKRTWQATLAKLLDGTLVALDTDPDALLVYRGQLHPWSHGGYGAPDTANARTAQHCGW
jgi:hypothetical protein